ncbi:thiamine-phosphate kinase [Tessaracoccus rhinocerotis]|uniref:Thiamine-monophosphate kinase n=1 Tax=Tessaracoccus rhinocerotis TaxID=1689449 RepID=A0A553JVX9_9ACTN|nr:thiamine-phosphate kinase [Tessaracoccus rhinocerotis]TRY16608.1 thiamine-phosphate kinase [Tessaracoccus rhinocerotis]
MDVGEFELISDVTADLPAGDDVLLGVGDDAAVLRPAGDVVVTTDMLVDGIHFRQNWSPAFQIGRKAVAVNVSDVESMGAVPSAIVMALGLPAEAELDWVRELSAGVRDEAARAGVSLVGGDTARSGAVVITVTALGNLDGRAPVTRSGAREGDLVAVAGRLGWAGAGLTVLQRGFGSPKELVAEQQCPSVPYGQGRVASEAGATSMVDISDGLLADLGHVCAASGVGMDLATSNFELPEAIQRVSAATGVSPWNFILAGGEDHALAATFPAGTELPAGWRRVGVVTGSGEVTVDGERWEGPRGWTHFG